MAEAVVEGVVGGVVEIILGKLGYSALQEIGLWRDVECEIDLLHTTVLGVKVKLHDAEDRLARGDDEVKDGLRKLKEVVYEADDLLDDFSTEVLRRQVMTGNKVAKKVRLFFSSSNQLAYDLNMVHKIKAIRKRLDVMDAGKHFNFLQPPSDTSTMVMAKKREQTHSSVPEGLVGRNDERNEIRQLLLSENYEPNVTVISIIGVGGVGKTALAQFTYNDEIVKSRFDRRMWVCVSDDFNVEKILESVIEKKSNINGMDALKNSLYKKINKKFFLLILDDVWNDEPEQWHLLRNLFVGGAEGSRILVTTRLEKVAKITSPVPQTRYMLKGLSEEDSWKLFAQMAFKPASVPPTLSHETIGREIVAKCKGIPLAIKATGGLMYFKEDKIEWELLRGKELAMIDPRKNNITRTLKVGYDLLPSHLKRCFAYCRLFPKDHVIHVDKLVALWMAQGYIDPSQRLEDIGRDCFMDLLRMSFFQDVEKDEYGNIVRCKIHDLMHDLASSVAGDESVHVSISNPREVDEKTRHISFDPLLNINNDIWQSMLEAKSLRSFLAPDGYGGDIGEGQCHGIFHNLRRLRQLDLQECGIETVPNSIRKMKQLRYLDLSCNRKIKMLPCSITRLQNLQVLNLKSCRGLRQLPKNIKELVSLKRLDIRDCDALTHMPRGIGQLTSLERLTRFVLRKSEKEECEIGELTSLERLMRFLLLKSEEGECESGGPGELRDKPSDHLSIDIDKITKSQNKESKSGGLLELHGLKLGGALRIENLRYQKNTTTPTTTTASVAKTCAADNANLKEKPRLERLAFFVRDVLTHSLDGIEQLTSFKLQESESGGLEELHDLNKLGGYLRIENLPHQKGSTTPTTPSVAETSASANANLREKPRLERLAIFVRDAFTYMSERIAPPESEDKENDSGRPRELHYSNESEIDSWLKGTTTPTPTSVAEICAPANANLRGKPRLQELELNWLPLEDFDDNEDEVSLEALWPHQNLKRLKVENYGGIKFADWLSSLTNLVRLDLYSCRKCQSLPPLDQFPSLKEIQIWGLTDLQYIDMWSCCAGGGGSATSSSGSNNSMVSFFPSLEKLELYDCCKLKGWRPPSSSSGLLPQFQFQCLSQLFIRSCPNLTSMPPVSPSLKKLQVSSVSFELLEQMLERTISPAHGPSSSSLPSNFSSSLEVLEIDNIEHLPEDFLPMKLLQTLTSLQELRILSCPTLTSLPHAKMLLLTSLKSLEISRCENLDLSNYDDDGNGNNNDAILWQRQGLRNLTSLIISDIPKLVHLPRRLLLHSIALRILCCSNLASLPEWMPKLTSLQYLDINNCSQLSERCKD